MKDETGTSTYSYDGLGRLLVSSAPEVGVITYEYDLPYSGGYGSYDKTLITMPNGQENFELRDGRNYLVAIGWMDGNDHHVVEAYDYFDNGRKYIEMNGLMKRKVEYDYFADGTLEKVVNYKPDDDSQNWYTGVTSAYYYDYNKNGDMVEERIYYSGAMERENRYLYDGLNRLIEVEIDYSDSRGDKTTEYKYDGSGNRTLETVSGSSVADENGERFYIYDERNRLITVEDSMVLLLVLTMIIMVISCLRK